MNKDIISFQKNKKLILIIVFGLLFFCFLVAVWRSGPNRKNLEVDFLDVGQGDSSLIKTTTGLNILIDGGPDKTVLRRLAENLPWWDRQIDLMVLTHPHDDHVVGLIDILKNYKVKKILYNGLKYDSPNYQTWLDLIKQKNIPLEIVDRPQIITLAKNCQLGIIYPIHSLAGLSMVNANNSSIEAKLIYGQDKLLFTGDAEIPVEEELIKNKIDLSADLIKIPHHGSDNGTSNDLLKAVGAKIGVIEVGKNNSFGHPSLRTINKLMRADFKIYRTDQAGTIKFFSDGQKLWRE